MEPSNFAVLVAAVKNSINATQLPNRLINSIKVNLPNIIVSRLLKSLLFVFIFFLIMGVGVEPTRPGV